MSFFRQVKRGLTALVAPAHADADVDREVRHFAEQRAAELVRAGMPYQDALRRATIELGNVTVTREEVRASGWEHGVDLMLGDIRYALRRLRREPGFTVVASLTLAIGIGAATAIFSAVNPILFRALPYPHAERIVTVAERSQSGAPIDPAYGTYEELSARSRSFDAMSATDTWRPSLTGTNEPERLEGRRVTASFFDVIGVRPALGRSFDAAEDVPGAASVVILSDRLLQRRFGGDRSIVGGSIMLNGTSYTVTGVMPRGFIDATAPSADVWAPLRAVRRAEPNSREWGHHYRILGRLKAGVDAKRVSTDLAAIATRPIPEFARVPWASLQNGVLARSLQEDVTADARPALLAIVAAAAVLLLLACVNVANLLLARSARRRGEFAVRAALGAGGRRLARQLLTESVILALVGGALGFVIASIGVGALVALSPAELPRADAIRLDAVAFAFGLAVTALVGVAAGVMPALHARRSDVRGDMQRSSRSLASARGFARSSLVVVEVALALVLLVGAGLLVRSLDRLFAVAPGIRPEHVLTMQVVDAGLTSQLPLSGDMDAYGFAVESFPDRVAGQDGAAMRYAVTPDYFRTMDIPLVRGRLLDATDRVGAPRSFVVSESFASAEFGKVDPIGQRVRFGPDANDGPWGTIVGVVGDVKQQSLLAMNTAAFYVPSQQWSWVDPVQSLVVHTTGDAASMTDAVRRAVWSVDRNKPITRIATMEQLIERTVSGRRFTSVIYQTFAVAALLLAAVGLYGVISGGVAERTREIGIRSALGATRSDVVRGVLRSGLGLTAVGVVIGVGGAIATSRLLETLLYGISRVDAVTYGGVVALLAGVAVLACWAPARRAAGVDPVITLRAE